MHLDRTTSPAVAAPLTSAHVEARTLAPVDPQEAARIADERKQLRRLQMMMNMTLQVIAQDGSLSVEEASQMIADSRAAALNMFPGKELAYDLIWKPRFQRAMLERFRLQ